MLHLWNFFFFRMTSQIPPGSSLIINTHLSINYKCQQFLLENNEIKKERFSEVLKLKL